MVKDGWHDIDKVLSVYTENGVIKRATKHRGVVYAVIYKWDKTLNSWVNVCGSVKYDTFRKGFTKGRYTAF